MDLTGLHKKLFLPIYESRMILNQLLM